MARDRSALIIVENSFIPLDIRVWTEARALRDHGWKVAIINPMPTGRFADPEVRPYQPLDREGITVYAFPLAVAHHGAVQFTREYLTASIAIARLSWRAWRARRFSVIHLCNPPDIFFPIALFYRLFGVRTIFDHHDLFPEQISERFTGMMRRVLYGAARVTEKLTFRSAHVVISTNESYRDVALKRGGKDARHVFVVRNGPRLSEFTPCQPDPALKQGFAFVACYVGVMGHEDGLLELAESIRHVAAELGRRDILFVLIGDGAVRAELLERLNTWQVGHVAAAPGMITDRLLVRQYLATADVCLAPEPLTPLNQHSSFIKISEYMAMGKPIVAYDLKETRFTAGAAAVYVQPGDTNAFGEAIATLIDQPAHRAEMGLLARQRVVETLSWEQQEDSLICAYETALAE